jgi:hypothetical protein
MIFRGYLGTCLCCCMSERVAVLESTVETLRDLQYQNKIRSFIGLFISLIIWFLDGKSLLYFALKWQNSH